MRLPGLRLNAICSAGPWKNILLGRSDRGGRGGGLWAGQEQGPGLLNKQLSTHGSPEPGLGLRFPVPFGPRGYPPSSAAGDTAVAEGTATALLCGVRAGTLPGWGPWASLCFNGMLGVEFTCHPLYPFKVYNSTVFSAFTNTGGRHHNQFWNIFITFRRNPSSFTCPPRPSPPPP